ncbi:MAG: hypothetical protein U1F26_04355 [Lysobacterales bacterium]
MRRCLLQLLHAVALLGLAAATPAVDYWSCADTEAILRGPDGLREVLGAAADGCRRTNVRGVDTLNCELARPRSAFGLSALEVSASVQQGGTRRLSFIFKAGSERVRQAVERKLPVQFEADLGGWLAISPDDVQQRYRVYERDDGATQLVCEVTGEPPVGVAGAVEGRLAWSGAGRQLTRVCAIPVDESLPIRCVELPAQLKRFRIDGLAAADYYIAAYELDDNPDGHIAAYARPLRDCTGAAPGCVAALLVPLRVLPGITLPDVRIAQVYAAVPERVARVRAGR